MKSNLQSRCTFQNNRAGRAHLHADTLPVGLLVGGVQDRRHGPIDILCGSGPVGHRDPYGRFPLPGRASQPAGSFLLHRLHDGAGAGVVVPRWIEEAHEHLIEDDIVEHLDPWLLGQGFGKRRAWAQQRSTRSATPDRPSERSAAYTGKPLARREKSGFQSSSSRSRSSE